MSFVFKLVMNSSTFPTNFFNMLEEKKDSLSQFMKKQISEKSSKKAVVSKTNNATKNAKSDDQQKENEKENDENQEEMTEEEKLEEAKKASRNKAGERDQTEMIKKLILENIIKYTVLISFLVILAIGIIKFGPAILAFLNGFLYKIIMGALGVK